VGNLGVLPSTDIARGMGGWAMVGIYCRSVVYLFGIPQRHAQRSGLSRSARSSVECGDVARVLCSGLLVTDRLPPVASSIRTNRGASDRRAPGGNPREKTTRTRPGHVRFACWAESRRTDSGARWQSRRYRTIRDSNVCGYTLVYLAYCPWQSA